MKTILIATTNQGKKTEILSALQPLDGYTFVSLADVGIDLDVPETGSTYAENALQKAKAYYAASGMPTLSEDSGIEINALTGELGIHTRRWGAGPDATDEEWMAHFMDRMTGEEDRSARFVSHAVFHDENGHVAFEGECRGHITTDIEGPLPAGIPLSGVFKPEGESLVYSAMDEEQKNALSHRGWSIRQLREYFLNQAS